MRYEYDAILHEIPENGGAYVAFPLDLKKELSEMTLNELWVLFPIFLVPPDDRQKI